MSKFTFPDGSWNRSLKESGDGYVAMWDDEDGPHIWELNAHEVEEYSEDDEEGVIPYHLSKYFRK